MTILEQLKAGYDNAMDNDLVACLSDNHKIGLVYHGAKIKQWKTEKGINND